MNGNLIAAAVLGVLIAWAAWQAIRRMRKGGGCCGEREQTVRRTGGGKKGRYSHVVRMEIGGMTCENCARRVENALNALEGVRASVRIDTREARVQCEAEPDEAALREAVRGAGYVVTACRTISGDREAPRP